MWSGRVMISLSRDGMGWAHDLPRVDGPGLPFIHSFIHGRHDGQSFRIVHTDTHTHSSVECVELIEISRLASPGLLPY